MSRTTWYVCHLPSRFEWPKAIIQRNVLFEVIPPKNKSEKLHESDYILWTCWPVRYSKNCPPLTESNALFRFQNRPFLDPFLAWSAQPTFRHPIDILPFWYFRRGFFYSRITLQLWLDFSTPLWVREVCIILRPFRKDQIPNSRCVMKVTIKCMNTFLDGSTPHSFGSLRISNFHALFNPMAPEFSLKF